MKKVIFVASVVKIHINVFHLPYLEWFKNNGFETHVAAKDDFDENDNKTIPYCDVYHNVAFERSPFSLKGIKAYKTIKKIIEENYFDIIHCHTPVASVLTRLAARKARKRGTKVIYTAHGFHFFKGAPLINWLLYYPVEKFLARFTDVLITINKEDYERGKKFKAKRIEYVPGVGVDTQKFKNIRVNINRKRKELEMPEDAVLILSVGELNKNKNHKVVIKALSKINNPNICYCICGQGNLKTDLISLAEILGIKNTVKFLGYRNDMDEIYKAADIFVIPSKREGLPRSLMEAMAAGLPVICSDIRGNTDLIIGGKGGYLCGPNDVNALAKFIDILANNENLRIEMGNVNLEAVKAFDIENVQKEMKKIYCEVLAIE